MTEEMEEEGAWVPLTPAKSLSAPYGTIKGLNHDVHALEIPQFSPILSEMGHAEKESGNYGSGFGNLDRVDSRSDNGSLDCVKRGKDCSGAVATKTVFLVSGNAGSGSESLEFSSTRESTMGEITDKGANPEVTWNAGSQPYDHILHCELRSDSAKASTMQENPKKWSRKGIESDKLPRKRMRMKRHRPKVFDECKPKRTSTGKPRAPKASSPKPQTPRPSTPKPRTSRYAKYVKRDSETIPVNSLKDVGFCEPECKSSSRRKLDFYPENCTMDQNAKARNEMGNEPEVELKKDSLNIPVDSYNDNSCCDLDKSSSGQKLSSGMENCTLDQNLKSCDGIENKHDAEPKLHSDYGFSRLQVYCRKIRRGNCILEQNSKASNKTENKPELEPKLQFDNNFSCVKVYHRKFRKGSCIMDQNSKAYDATEKKSEVEPKLRSDNRFDCLKVYRRIFRANECLKSSRKLGPNCPFVYKRKRMRQQKATVFDKLIKHVGMTTHAQRQKRTRKRTDSYFMEEYLNDSKELSPRKKSLTVPIFAEKIPQKAKAVERQTFDKCTLNVTWTVNFKRKRSRTSIRRQNFSCFINGVAARFSFKRKRSKTCSRRKDYSFFINGFSTILQVSEDFLPKASGIRIREKKIILEGKKHLKSDARSCKKKPQHDPRTFLPSINYVTEAMVDYVVMRMASLHIDDGCNQLVVRDQISQGALVASKGKFDLSKRRKQQPKVDLDAETMRVWNLLMETGWSEDAEEKDNDRTEYWREQREIFRGRVDSFIARMHLIQGDRRFSPWKGSVVDSVVGVFLTQNVSDNLSSSAFMNLASKYPPSFVSKDSGCDDGSNGVNEIQHMELVEPPSVKCRELVPMEEYSSSTLRIEVGFEPEGVNGIPFQTESTTGKPKANVREKQENKINWDDLRTKSSHGRSRKRTYQTVDSVNWEAVRQAPVEELAKVIMERGMNNMLAKRIKDFLDRIVRDHGSIDLEWLRDVPQDKAKEYLLSITGLGLKSAECVRLLTLQHHAFPVDTNVGRILVRLGWVPLQPLPGDVQIHLLNDYPPIDTIQKYIWPRLCNLTKLLLYELHYQMITFGKLFCTKKLPNCNACPMRGECRHFASAYASANHRLEGPRDRNETTDSSVPPSHKSMEDINQQVIPGFSDDFPEGTYQYHSSNCEPIVELPASPEPACMEILERDIEDFGYESSNEEIPTIKLSSEELNVLRFMDEEDVSRALTSLSPEIASIPMPKLKYVGRLRTVHHVYELPNSHILLAGYEKQELDDPCPHLLAIWTPDELNNPFRDSKQGCSQESGCDMTASSGDIVQYENDKIVRGTILIPCRTANRGSFPLNGTYFQVNEVFADYESSRNPIAIPREWIWNLRRRTLYCGTSATAICRGMSLEEVVYTFRKGFICVRGFDRVKRAPRPLSRRFHLCKTRKVDDDL